MVVIGLTGGIGSGKSTVAAMFQELGVPVYFSDVEAKMLMGSSVAIKEKLIAAFGPDTFGSGGLNRSYLAELVFNDKENLKKLNQIVHPEVRRHFKSWVELQKASYVIQEHPLIFENNSQSEFDFVITVTAPSNVRIKRVMKRDQLKEHQVDARIKNQLEDDFKVSRSDYVIENDKLLNTRHQVQEIHKDILNRIP